MLISIVVIVLVYNIEETNGKQVVHCGDVGFLQYGDIIASREPPYTVGTVLEFACDRGFKGKGKRRISCLKSGYWSDPVPYCAPNSCQRDLTRVDERRKCRKTCITNQNCRGGFKQCLCDDWCGKTCFNPDADCAVPKIPENGYIIKNKISYGNTITYGCNEGFTLAGPITRRCQSDRRWSGNEPKCAAFSSCGHSTFETHSKIFGKVHLGTDAENGEWPWQVLLFHKNKNLVRKFYDKTSGFGGGSIINGQWILSAAHVFDPLPYRNPEKYFLIAAGMTKYPTEDQDIPDQINFYEAEKIRKHQDYDSSTFDYDIAMIRVGKRLKREGNIFVHDIDEIDGSITFSQYIRPVCLPCMKGDMLQNVDIWKNFDKRLCNFKSRSSMPYGFSAGEKAIVTGFGEKRDSDAEHHYRPSSLQRGELEILGDNKCVDAIRKIQGEDSDARYTNRMICAVSANKTLNVDACKGDSGGPLVKQLGKSSDYTQWLQIGVVSWGWKCGNEYPGFYTSVPKLMPWIWKTLDDSKNKIVLDYCLSSPCKNNGDCQNKKDGFSCSCVSGYRGNRCEIKINDCIPNPCFNEGTCHDKVNDFSCSCVDGYKGKLCEIDIDDCSPNPCMNGGSCKDKINNFLCTCPEGYSGKKCLTDINDCLPNPCQNEGKCVDRVNDYLCSCVDGFKGKRCEIEINNCRPNPCGNRGVCATKPGGYSCYCVIGFRGTRCESNINDCLPNPCQNKGKCVDRVNDFSCSCVDGFKGKRCEIEINNCRPNPCGNEGVCTTKPGGYSCFCPNGFEGTRCESNINDCLPNPCLNGGNCVDRVNDFSCSCVGGFKGKRCEIEINNCDPNPCRNGGLCTTKPGGYLCFCPNGFRGTRCESNINDCLPNPCHHGGKCHDKVNDFFCSCLEGYKGKKCETSTNYCQSSPCKNEGRCRNLPRGFECFCRAGFSGNTCEIGRYCSQNPCFNGGKCYEAVDGFTCKCPSDFMGRKCEVDAECPPLENPKNGYVVVGKVTYGSVVKYVCNDGYTLVGLDERVCTSSRKWSGLEPTCVGTNYCQSSPCKNEGKCRNLPRGFECFCRAGFSGNTCEIGRYCSQNPCFNGGKCYEAVDGFTCKCPSDFMGRKCEVDAECPPLENPKNGYVVVGKVTYGSVVKYVCNDGYTLVGLDERVCTSSRKWSGLEPTCVDFSECGVTGPLDPNLHNQLATRRVKRVVGGDDAPDNAWPWHASILVAAVESGNINVSDTLKRWELTIAGTIINKQWILTVTHPTEHMPLENFYRHQVIVVGVSSRSFVKNTIKTTVQMFRISKYILHEEFNKLTFQNDIALIKLGERLFPRSTVPFVNIKEITFNAAVRPVCLPCTQKCVTSSHIGHNFKSGWDMEKKCEAEGEFLVKPGIKIVLTGFGTNETDYNIHTFPDRLQQVVLEVGDKNSCQRGIDDISFIRRVDSFDVFNSTFCTVSSIPHKVMAGCIGDGGAPVVRKITQRDGSVCWVQVGISSFGAQCDGKIPEFYTKVANHINWVQETMLKN
uniref:uncharacterized protein LOC120344327 isoform X6 n=1 Tax=Styela clava TaxID=7725 RepID=UPI00193A3EE5|nr:uncharacterized protein LOC120344327 isoform X6 [Styela clava]